jgi:glycosyltransferase involved in cell wall biosynthesis
MNIAILSTFVIEGGAPIAAWRLHKGLREIDQGSSMIVKVKSVEDRTIHRITVPNLKNRLEEKAFFLLERQLNRSMRTALSNTYFSPPYPMLDLAGIDIIQKADVLNLHWVAKFLSVESIAHLLNSGKPVVWTLHDQNPFTGGCHYSAGCEKYMEDCRDCPQLKDDRFQIPFRVLKKKLRLWGKNLVIVTPSRWLAGSARQSRLFRDLRIEVIPNSLETDLFKPTAKAQAKQELGLDPQAFALLLGAYTGFERRKGYHELLDALRHCLKNERFQRMNRAGMVKILAFGPPQDELKEFFLDITSFGYITDPKQLATVYSAADAFLLPSREDNLPNTMLESMACGTPVLSFEIGGMPDMIENGVTGYMAPAFDTEKFGELILKMAFDEKRSRMGRTCRRLIEEKFKLQDQAKKYAALYEDLLAGTKRIERAESEGKADRSGIEQEIVLSEQSLSVPKDLSPLYRMVSEELTQEAESRRTFKKWLRRILARRGRSGHLI